jgi:GNAT superfamily N-acetyltransferase
MPAGQNRRMTDGPDEELTGAGGTVVARYTRETRAGMPCAELVAELAPRAEVVAALLAERPGWVIVTGEALSAALLDAGATRMRHSYQMLRDLRADPPPAEWAELEPPAGLRLVPLRAGPDAPVADLRALTERAYPPGHPDHSPVDGLARLHEAATDLLRDATPPPCPSSAAVYAGDRPVAAVLNGHRPGETWVFNVMRDPAEAYAGLGTLLLRRAEAVAAGHGDAVLGLAVSHGNPARAVYARLGFRTTGSYVTVVLPGA